MKLGDMVIFPNERHFGHMYDVIIEIYKNEDKISYFTVTYQPRPYTNSFSHNNTTHVFYTDIFRWEE